MVSNVAAAIPSVTCVLLLFEIPPIVCAKGCAIDADAASVSSPVAVALVL